MKFFKLAHKDAQEPRRATKGSIAYDVYAVDDGEEVGRCLMYDTGIKLGKLPKGCGVKLYPRSSISKTDLRLANSVGLIDADYPDTIKVCFDFFTDVSFGDLKRYKKGDRIAQLCIEKFIIEEDEIKPIMAREGGFGSTDRPVIKTKKGKK